MNEEQDDQKSGPKKVTLGLVLGWGFGVLVAISGVTLLVSEPVAAILMLLLAAVLLPPANKFVTNKFNFSLSRGVKVVVVLILLIVIGTIMPKESTPNITAGNEQDNVQVTDEKQREVRVTENPVVREDEQQEIVPQVETVTENNPSPAQVQQTDDQNTTPVSSESVSQKNAVRKAKEYLNYSAFSHDGLVAQLEYDQFSHVDAVYGADNAGANWNEQAAKKAKSYMEYSAFSHGSLIEQLKYDEFTQAQAEYGADAVGL